MWGGHRSFQEVVEGVGARDEAGGGEREGCEEVGCVQLAVHHLGGNSSQFENNCLTEMCSGSETGSSLRRIDSCITQLKA